MSKEVVTNVKCDACELEGGPVEPGVEVRVVFVPQAPKAIDLCERHTKELVAPLRDLIEEAGQPIVDGRARPASTVKRRKPVVVGDPDEPVLGVRGKPMVVPPLPDGNGWACPECGEVKASAGGLGAHRRSHGVDGQSPAALAYHARK